MIRRQRRLKLFIVLAIGVIVHNECLSFFLASWKWAVLPTPKDPESVRILFVADPQLLGEKDEPPSLFGTMTRLDSDCFISRTFSLALLHVRPDLVVFLGDLLDEGSRASDSAMQRYVRRFRRVFATPHDLPRVSAIFLPGDNDIGGEGFEAITPNKSERFQKHFGGSANELGFRFLKFFRLRELFLPMDGVSDTLPDDISIRIVLSHFSILNVNADYMEKEMKRLRPHLIFSAHEHRSSHLYRNFLNSTTEEEANRDTRYLQDPKEASRPAIFQLAAPWSSVDEFVVPTCSYRMGVPDMAFASCLIERSGAVAYAVLWLPSRFHHLLLYLGLILGFVFSFLVPLFSFFCCRSQKCRCCC